MEIILFRGHELASEVQFLAAETYNMARILLGQSAVGHIFIPIRNMQYLAVIDNDEIVFVDSSDKKWVTIAWTDFKPQQRTNLHDPVSYVTRYYRPIDPGIMLRLRSEFNRVLRSESSKRPQPQIARIIKLPAGSNSS